MSQSGGGKLSSLLSRRRPCLSISLLACLSILYIHLGENTACMVESNWNFLSIHDQKERWPLLLLLFPALLSLPTNICQGPSFFKSIYQCFPPTGLCVSNRSAPSWSLYLFVSFWTFWRNNRVTRGGYIFKCFGFPNTFKYLDYDQRMNVKLVAMLLFSSNL